MKPKLYKDKYHHVAMGIAVALATLWLNPITSMALVITAGVGKEIYDKVSGKGTPEVMDAVATVIGGALVILPSLLL